jgi:hypothetical protein
LQDEQNYNRKERRRARGRGEGEGEICILVSTCGRRGGDRRDAVIRGAQNPGVGGDSRLGSKNSAAIAIHCMYSGQKSTKLKWK